MAESERMGNDLMSWLRCPACGDALTRAALPRAAAGEGLLRSGCGLWFPIVDDIPRIFVGEMRALLGRDFGDFLVRHGLDAAAPGAGRDTRHKLSTHDSFGYEWTHFHEMLPEWEENARFYFEPIGGAAALAGCTVLDAGCGKGRHAYYAARSGARLVAVDFSRAIDVARRNCAGLPGERLFVQCDLMSLPFAAGVFDAAYSFGVLHHLPDPEGGFRRVVATVRPGGQVLFYVYHALEEAPVKRAVLRLVSAARRVTTRLPHPLLLGLSQVLGYGLYGGVVMPYKLLSRLGPTRALAERLPLKTYARYPVRVIVNDQFDRFSAPIENRYRRAEVEAWLAGAGLTDGVVLGGAGWRAAATRPAS